MDLRHGFRNTLLAVLILLVFSACQTPQSIEVPTELELDLARQGVREIALLSARNAMSSLPPRIEGLSEEELFGGDLLTSIARHRDKAGIQRRLTGLEQALKDSLIRFVRENGDSVDSLIVLNDLSDPFTLIEGDSDAVTRYMSTFFLPIVSDSVTDFLASDEQVAQATEAFFSILNSILKIEAFREGTIAPHSFKKLSYTQAINSILSRLTQEMGKEEGIIRSLAIDYESPAIRLFAL
ncbi:MAG: hypothetical protein JXK93_05600 [Sphaerochaetaceae bacterium]|nr:hypothetical protein [Sphaerochaetaceae bacterium]